MAGRISRIPAGLLGLLDLKVGGESPPDFGSMMLPTLDARDFYFNGQIKLLATSVTLTATLDPIVVPSTLGVPGPADGHVWYVRQFWGNGTGTLATLLSIQLCMKPSGSAANFGVLLNQEFTVSANHVGGASVRDFWMTPGDRLAVKQTSSPAVAGPTLAIGALYIDMLY
jgi:hypothetical protein